MNTAALPTSKPSAPPTISQISKRTRKPQSMTTSTSLSSSFMKSTQVSQHPHGRPTLVRQMGDIHQCQRPRPCQHNNSVEPVPDEVKALHTEFQQSLHALSTRFDNFQRNNDNGEGGRGSNKDNSGNNGRNDGNDNRRKGKNNTSRRRYPYDTNKSCELHGRGPVSYPEGDTVQKIVLYSNGKLANYSHQPN
jgi:hypothetical protein